MKVVQSVPFGARGCAVTGRSADREGFIETTSKATGDRLHISAEAVKIMGDEFGMISRDDAIALRFDLHEAQKNLREAEDKIADMERLESDLVDARETIAERDDILATIDALGEQGLTVKQIKGVLDRFARLKEDLLGAEGTVEDLLDTVTKIAALKDGRKKVLA
jgi:hypothetical protein